MSIPSRLHQALNIMTLYAVMAGVLLSGIVAIHPVYSKAPVMLDPLTVAVRQGDHLTVERLLQQGMNVNIVDPYGQSPLMYAVNNNDTAMVETLLGAGANPNVINQYNVTPLKLSYFKQNARISMMLVQKGASSSTFTLAEWRALQQQLTQAGATHLPSAPALTRGTGTFTPAAKASGLSNWVKPAIVVGVVTAGVAGVAVLAASDESDADESGTFVPDPPSTPAPAPPGGGAPPNPPVESFNTAEYQAQAGLAQINVTQAYARGATGSGVTVAVIDSGVDISHPDLAGNLASDGQDFVDSGTAAPKGSGIGRSHGTNAAGIIAAIKNDTGMHGVAYDARILPIRAGDSTGLVGGTGDTIVPNAYNYAVAQGAHIANGSFGSSVYIGDPSINAAIIEASIPNQIGAYQAGVTAGMVHVFATGNESNAQVSIQAGMPFYFSELQPLWLAVTSVNSNNDISSFSNRCGLAANWCLAAPGENIFTTSDQADLGQPGANASVSGTSFSAPHVAGALAVLMDAFPTLTPAQAVDLLLTTATDLGDPGTDAVYGRGLVNLDAATQPQGAMAIALSSHIDQLSAPLDGTSLQLAAPFGDSLNQLNGTVMVLDRYQRPYNVTLNQLQRRKENSFDRSRAFLEFGTARYEKQVDVGDNISLAYSNDDKQRFYDSPTPKEHTGRYAFRAQVGDHEVSGQHNTNVAEAFSFGSSLGYATHHRITPSTLANPYLALVDSGTSLAHALPVNRRLTFRFGSFRGDMLDDNGGHRANGVVGALSYRPSRHTTLGVQAGSMIEKRTFLGSESGGALALEDDTRTVFYGVNGAWQLNRHVSLHGSYMTGHSTLQAGNRSLFSSLSDVRSDSFSVGATVSHVIEEGHQAGIALTQPLRVSHAQATLNVPVARDLDGNVVREGQRLDLAPEGRELDLESFYYLPLEEDTGVTFGGMIRFEPEHQQDAEPDGLFMVKYNRSF